MGTRRDVFRIVDGYEELLRRNGLASLEALFAVPNDHGLTKPDLAPWRERLRLTVRDQGGQRTLYLKRFDHPPRKARRDVRRSGSGARSVAGTEWAWMHRLAADGIACVTPVALGEELQAGREVRSAILSEAVAGDSLERWFGQWDKEGKVSVRSLIVPLAALVARFHQCGYRHRDLYLSHVFYDPTNSAGSSLHLIDLQRVIRPRWRHQRWLIKDLAALNYSAFYPMISHTDRLRWLCRYLGVPRLDGPAKRLVYRVIGKTQRIAHHDRRRGAKRHAKEER